MNAVTRGLRPKVAIIGSGISGLSAAYYLNDVCDITVFEADNRIGGHTATIDVQHDGQSLAIDTGFIVFNDWTYPRFKKLLSECQVSYQPTTMGFSVSCGESGLEYSGEGFNGFFAQRGRLLSLSHWRLLADIMRFNRAAIRALANGELDNHQTLGDFLAGLRLSPNFAKVYLIPMASAIWSKSTAASLAMPARFFVAFFKNHGLLSITNQPQWHVIRGGSRAYLGPLTHKFADRIHVGSPVASVRRTETGVLINVGDQSLEFDQVIFACHSDQALAALAQPTAAEKAVLSAIPYQNNDVVLHWDETLLPRNRACWSSWNYRLTGNGDRWQSQDRAVLTYNMNILQGITSPHTYCVTLNQTEAINPDKILGQFSYAHPTFNQQSVAAQGRWHEINGVDRTWFCGAWWANGFHEDGVDSAWRVATALRQQLTQASTERVASL